MVLLNGVVNFHNLPDLVMVMVSGIKLGIYMVIGAIKVINIII